MQLTRLELYTRVCKSPLSKLAPEFGISGTALAAICKRYAIPYPGSGYLEDVVDILLDEAEHVGGMCPLLL